MLQLGTKSSVIREIFEYANKRKAEIGEDNVFDFSLGNPNVPTPEKVTKTMENLLKTVDPAVLHGYTSAVGSNQVRKKIAESLNERFNVNATENQIYMTCGAAASLTITLKALVNEGNEIIVLAPFFPEYSVFIENAGGIVKVVPCNTVNFQIDFNLLSVAINKKTKAIIINSPNNPSGVVFTEETLKELAELLNKKKNEFGTEIYIIADEPYRELVYGNVTVPFLPNIYNNTIVCYSYSKALSLAGERIGYIFVPQKVTDGEIIYKAVCGAGRSMGYVCAPSMLQFTISECQNITSDISVYEHNRNILYNFLSKLGYEVVKPDGAFYLFVKSLEPNAMAFCEKAKEYELLLVPGNDFGIEGFVRISYCVSTKTIKNSLPSFEKLYKSYKGEK